MKKFEDLTFADHYMFEKVLQNKEICKELLERLLKIKIERLEYPEIEKEISPYYESKGVRLDVYVKDTDKVFDVELQNALDETLDLRTRYYQSILDMDSLIKGEHYSELPTSYIIFICNFDPFNKDIPIYTFFTKCNEIENLTLEDKMIKKMFNAKAYFKESDIEIKSLLEYISSRKPVDDFTDKIHNLISKIKKKEVNKREYENMNIHDQDTFYRGKKEGIQQGAYQKSIETAKKFILMKLPLEQISEGTGLSLEIVEKLAKEEVVKS